MPLPPEKEARGSIGSPPSNRLRACALYPFSLPIPMSVALKFSYGFRIGPYSWYLVSFFDSLCGGVPRAPTIH
jgi:hypothetical protein